MWILKMQETEFVYAVLQEFQSEMSHGTKSRLFKTDERESSKVLSYDDEWSIYIALYFALFYTQSTLQ